MEKIIPILPCSDAAAQNDNTELELLLAKYDVRDEWKRIGDKLKEIRS